MVKLLFAIFILLTFSSFSPLHAKEQGTVCNYERVYCKARTDRVAMVKGPSVRVQGCGLQLAVNEAMARLWNFCGGRTSTTCQRPISCMAVDNSDYEVEVSYLGR